MVRRNPVGSSWDAEYRRGRYADDPPVAFVETILATLRAQPALWRDAGLYVGCGNGRNYLPLIDAGAALHGIDLSREAIEQLIRRRPELASRVSCGDYRALPDDGRYGSLVAIQVFQHGDAAAAAGYFAKAAAVLRPGGLLFVRVNSVGTEIYHRHTVVERDDLGGLTIRYDTGPKRGLLVHFYAREELLQRADPAFEVVLAPREDVIRRAPPKAGSWAQWEGAWRRRGVPGAAGDPRASRRAQPVTAPTAAVPAARTPTAGGIALRE